MPTVLMFRFRVSGLGFTCMLAGRYGAAAKQIMSVCVCGYVSMCLHKLYVCLCVRVRVRVRVRACICVCLYTPVCVGRHGPEVRQIPIWKH